MNYLVNSEEMRALDQRTIDELGVPGRTLMEVAGQGVATACLSLLSARERVAVACGTGNNGGDGFVAARALAAGGFRVSVFIFGAIDKVKGDALGALEALTMTAQVPIVEVRDETGIGTFSKYLAQSALAVDALVGTGLKDDVRGHVADAIDILNGSNCSVLAVDIPSGVSSDTGAMMGRAIRAARTVTFAFAKLGHYMYPGASCCGEISVIDIGIPISLAAKQPVRGRLLKGEGGPALLPRRKQQSHKGTFGHVAIWAGSRATPGAALLALEGALRSGAGLVSWVTDEETLKFASARPPEVMLRIRDGAYDEAWVDGVLRGVSTLVIGPGLSSSDERREALRLLLGAAHVPLCLDADALNLLAANEDLWSVMRRPLVITPHPKEMARLAGMSVEKVQADRFDVATRFAMERQCVVVLKGSRTIVAGPDGVGTVICAGNPGLATGGTGDVLAGVMGGLLAQGLDATTAARAGALMHGLAGDAAAENESQTAMTATDVIAALGPVLRSWDR